MSAETLTVQARVAYPGFGLAVSETLALDGVCALFGPSGSGKSTLLRAIAGFEAPLAGRIALGDRVWFDSAADIDLAAHRRPVGFMFQDARLFPHLDVAGNLAFADRRSGARAAAYGREDIVAALDLAPLLDRRPAALSGGERQRVALGRTLLTRPRLLLLDEPLSALDHERKSEILPYLEALPRRFRVPTLYVSHSVDEIARIADRVVVLTGGRVQSSGPTAEILERLDLDATSGHFDAGVLVLARVVEHDRRLRLTRVDAGGDTLTLPLLAGAVPGQAVRLRIRARDVAVATSRPVDISIRNVLQGEVASIEPQPDSAFADVLVKRREGRILARLTRAAVEDLGLEVGRPVFALVKSVCLDRRP